MKKIFFLTSCLLLLSTRGFCQVCSPEDSTCSGFLHLPVIGLSQIFQYSPTFYSPCENKPGHWHYSSTFYWVNIWALNFRADTPWTEDSDLESFPFRFGSFLMDMEVIQMMNRVGYGFNDKTDINVTVPVYYIGGGILDGMIENFHDLFDIDQKYRDKFPRDDVNLFYIDPDGTRHILSSEEFSGLNLGDVEINAGYKIRTKHPSVMFRLGLKIPTHTGLIPSEQDGLDAAVMCTTAWRFHRWKLFHGISIVRYGDKGYEAAHFHRYRLTSANTLEYSLTEKVSLLGHLVLSTPYADYPQLDENILEISLGCRVYTSLFRLDVGLIENVFWYNNSPDFGIVFELNKMI